MTTAVSTRQRRGMRENEQARERRDIGLCRSRRPIDGRKEEKKKGPWTKKRATIAYTCKYLYVSSRAFYMQRYLKIQTPARALDCDGQVTWQSPVNFPIGPSRRRKKQRHLKDFAAEDAKMQDEQQMNCSVCLVEALEARLQSEVGQHRRRLPHTVVATEPDKVYFPPVSGTNNT
ncbi:uncharacterized protein MCYG_05774 [Microsporum canis CBS 113480]|uniref:Uncharacterized protein n=1 Tax=Arthroderma otae (strain ATCC MYA-4605 / CBS 113480) TaxID=554155 RepID=C5FSV2_ARTOC|nr:uncharacterized protein MCYG_05774 [Microsporum canis CBS 113480]EEQ32955.1 predicted protein [Microsporum canis CBS 113480]